MNLELIVKMAHSPVKNYAIPGLTSYLISESESGIIRLFHIERDHIEPITPHSHRFDFHCIVLEGEVENILYTQCAIFESGDNYQETISVYDGEIGKYKNRKLNILPYNLTFTKYQMGDQYSMKYNEIHSIRFKKGTKVLFFEGVEMTNSSLILEPYVHGEHIENFKVESWMFKKD